MEREKGQEHGAWGGQEEEAGGVSRGGGTGGGSRSEQEEGEGEGNRWREQEV